MKKYKSLKFLTILLGIMSLGFLIVEIILKYSDVDLSKTLAALFIFNLCLIFFILSGSILILLKMEDESARKDSDKDV